MDENRFDFVGLFDFDAAHIVGILLPKGETSLPIPDSDTVDARFDQDSLVFVSRNRQRGEESLGRRSRFNLWNIVSLGRLRCEIRP